MKKSRLILAIIAMAIVAIAVAFVSCKKDSENALNQKATLFSHPSTSVK